MAGTFGGLYRSSLSGLTRVYVDARLREEEGVGAKVVAHGHRG